MLIKWEETVKNLEWCWCRLVIFNLYILERGNLYLLHCQPGLFHFKPVMLDGKQIWRQAITGGPSQNWVERINARKTKRANGPYVSPRFSNYNPVRQAKSGLTTRAEHPSTRGLDPFKMPSLCIVNNPLCGTSAIMPVSLFIYTQFYMSPLLTVIWSDAGTTPRIDCSLGIPCRSQQLK